MTPALAIPDTVLGSIAGACLGGLAASSVVAFLTQRWTERRERRNRRDELQLELYLEVLDLVHVNEVILAGRTTRGQIAPAELQVKRMRISHRLKLLGSPRVRDAYRAYHSLVYEETANDLEDRPRDGSAVIRTRDALIEAMKNDVQTA